MDPTKLLWISGILFLFATALVACGRGFQIDRLSAFGIDFALKKPITVSEHRWLYVPAALLLVLSIACAGYSIKENMLPQRWPEQFSELKKAEIRVSEVDDQLLATINGQQILDVKFGEATDWVEITSLLRPGENAIGIRILNGRYGGCGGRVELRLNGIKNSAFAWAWGTAIGITEDRLPGIICYEHVKSLPLPDDL